MYLFFDTETTGLPLNWKAPVTNTSNWPRMVQLAWLHYDANGKLLDSGNHIIRPEGFSISLEATKIHGISTEKALAEGEALAVAGDPVAARAGLARAELRAVVGQRHVRPLDDVQHAEAAGRRLPHVDGALVDPVRRERERARRALPHEAARAEPVDLERRRLIRRRESDRGPCGRRDGGALGGGHRGRNPRRGPAARSRTPSPGRAVLRDRCATPATRPPAAPSRGTAPPTRRRSRTH